MTSTKLEVPFAHPLSRLQPWSRLSEALLKPLPADWRYNIQQAFSQLGDALGKFMGDGQQKQRVGGALRVLLQQIARGSPPGCASPQRARQLSQTTC